MAVDDWANHLPMIASDQFNTH